MINSSYSFQLRVLVTDKGVPTLSSAINVKVIVDRVEGNLAFTQQDYFRTIDESTAVDTNVIQARARPGVSEHFE